jgi:hypothetical protein
MGNVPPNNADFLIFRTILSTVLADKYEVLNKRFVPYWVHNGVMLLSHKKLGIQFALSHYFQNTDCVKTVVVCLCVLFWLLRNLLKVNITFFFKNSKGYK